MNRIIVTISYFILLTTLTWSQNDVITLSSGDKIRKLSLSKPHELRLVVSQFCENGESGKQQISGMGLEYSNQMIIIKPTQQMVYYKDQSKFEKKEITYYNSEPMSFTKDKIIAIEYRSDAKYHLYNTGGLLLSLGIITALVVAPLISLKSNSGFNTSRYYSTAGIGLVAIGVGIPMMTLCGFKKYSIANVDNKNRRIWTIMK